MKILFYSDVHFRDTSSYPPFSRIQENGLTGELNNILLGFNFIENQIIENDPDLVINLGDTYHKDNYISIRTLYSSSIGFKKISNICNKKNIDHLIIAGNHDIYSTLSSGLKLTSISSLEAYGTVITNNEEYVLNEYKIFIMPYITNLEEAYQGLVSSSSCDLLATHMDFLGAVNDNNHPVENGLDSHTNVLTISGHIHLPQEVGNVVYIGSLVQNRFTRDSLEDAGGVLVLDTDTGSKRLIQNNLSRHFLRIKDLKNLDNVDPSRCILKVYSNIPEEDNKKLLQGFEYIYILNINKEEKYATDFCVKYEIDKPEKILRDYISTDKPEYLNLFDNLVGDVE